MTTLHQTSLAGSFGYHLSGASFFKVARNLIALHKQRKALGILDDNALKDLGLTRAAAASEAARFIWDVPAHWRK